MKIDKTSQVWSDSPWYVKLSMLSTTTTEALQKWSSVLIFLGSVFFFLSFMETSFRLPAYIMLLGAYFNKSTELWVDRNIVSTANE